MPQHAAPLPGAETPLSRFALRLLDRLARGTRLRTAADGNYRGGTLVVPPALVHELVGRDLIAEGGGELVLTGRGQALLRRRDAAMQTAPGPAPKANPFAAQHQDRRAVRIKTGEGIRIATANMAESPLWWLKSRRDSNGQPFISDAQFAAGERLRADWEMAHRGPRLTMNWDAPPLSRSPRAAPRETDAAPAELRAKERVGRALDELGQGLADAVIRVCCHHQGLEATERALGWPQRSAKLVLGLALDRLARHYGIVP